MVMDETERPATVRELEGLRRQVEMIDAQGTRGVALIVSTQVGALSASVSAMRAETRDWQKDHTLDHEREKRDRVTGRRWLVGTGIAAIAALVAMLGLLLDIAGQVHR
jgi:hypothetical protein